MLIVTVCRDCGTIMIRVMSFSKDKHEKFCRCPKCHGETKHNKIRENDLSFGEYLSKEMKRK